MSEIIERVADSLHAALVKTFEGSTAEPMGRSEPFWPVLARAVIEAMREPTEAMVEAARLRHRTALEEGHTINYGMAGIYRAAIDQALKDTTL